MLITYFFFYDVNIDVSEVYTLSNTNERYNKIWPVYLLTICFVFIISFFLNAKPIYALETHEVVSATKVVSTQAEVISSSKETVSVSDVAKSYKLLQEKLETNQEKKEKAIIQYKKAIEEKRKNKLREDVVEKAESKLGSPYVWGATGPNYFDCSGLTQWSYRQIGISIPRVAAVQAQAGKRIDRNELKAGDLIFFRTDTSSPNRISHVGMYIGNGKFIHAPRTGDVVKVSSLSGYYLTHYAWSCRYID